MADRVRVYRAADGWRWQRKAPNGEIVAASTEGYAHLNDAYENLRRVNTPDGCFISLEADE